MASKYKIGLETKILVMVCNSGQDVNVRNRNYKKKSLRGSQHLVLKSTIYTSAQSSLNGETF